MNALQRSAVSRIQHRRFGPSGHAHGGHGLIQCDDGLDEDDIDLDDVPMPVVSSASSDSMSAVNSVSYVSIWGVIRGVDILYLKY